MKFVILLLFISLQILYSQRKETLEYSPYSDTIEPNKIDKSVAQALYSFVKNRIDFVQYDDNENCDLRAHLICFVLEKKFVNLKLGKAWLFGDSKRASKKFLYEDGGSSYLALGSKGMSWGYHVAPVIILGNDTLIIDPTTQNTAVPLRKWAKDLIPLGSKGFIVIKNNEYFCFPSDDENMFLDNTVIWDNPGNESEPVDAYTDIAEKISVAYAGILDPSKVVFFKNKIIDLCN
jgi:hypothetical protein